MSNNEVDINNYIPLLHKIAGDFPYTHREELVNEGYLALYNAQKHFKLHKGIPFETYAYKAVKYAMNKQLKSMVEHLSLDVTVGCGDDEVTTFGDLIESNDDTEAIIENKDLYRHFMTSGNRIHRFVKERHFEVGMSPQMIVELYAEVTQIRDHRKIKEILTPVIHD